MNYRIMRTDKDGKTTEVKPQNGLNFTEEIIGPDRLKETTEHIWQLDWKNSWWYFQIDKNQEKYKNITKDEFIKLAKGILMKEIQKQFDSV